MSRGDRDQTRLAMAALAACIVQILRRSAPDARPTADEVLQRAYEVLRDSPLAGKEVLETLGWMAEFLKELDRR